MKRLSLRANTQAQSTTLTYCNLNHSLRRFINEAYMDMQAKGQLSSLDKDFIDWEHMELKVGLEEGKDYYLIS